ncbi:hypothetical protein [Bradyrhizobium sp. SZCCHNPS1003]|uniref:hypothetical protein n=1 Tax=Bradyrhizobium sp. SZCCHNPS1003 TaxID=3057330 RepID=UPI0028EB53D3|nr:hypothetical protein [Bradyrhizobium sp. SZCCHNPS1003]
MIGIKVYGPVPAKANDAAIVVRENGEMEMFIRQAKGDEELPPGQVVLALFGMTFHDERVRRPLAQIVKEKQSPT